MPPKQPDTDALVGSLRLGVMRLARRLRRERGEENLTLTQLSLLGTLELNGSCTLGELAAEEKISAPSVTRIVNALVESGLVDRNAHETDGRQIVATLTPAAVTLLERNRLQRNRWLANQLRGLTDEQRSTLARAAIILDDMARA